MPRTIKNRFRYPLKRALLRRRGVVVYHDSILDNVDFLGKATIDPYCRISGDPRIVIGRNFQMNRACNVQGNITIGDDVLIGPKVIIWGRDHDIAPGELIRKQKHVRAPIVIGDDVWIAAGAIILKGVSIGSGAVIGAGAVVSGNIPAGAIAVGDPARVVKYRDRS